MEKKVKLSSLVKLHTDALPVIEKAMLDVVWDEEDQSLNYNTAMEVNKLGSVPGMAVEKDVPLGLGDTDALIRFFLSLVQLHRKNPEIRKEHFERLFIQLNRRVYKEAYNDIFSDEEN